MGLYLLLKNLPVRSDGGGGFKFFKCPWFHLEVDTCLDADVCDQVCISLNDSLTCGCYQDYKRSPTTGECKAKGESQIMTYQHKDWKKNCFDNFPAVQYYKKDIIYCRSLWLLCKL